MFSVPLGKYQGAWLLDYMVGMCLVLYETAKLSSCCLHHFALWSAMTVPVAPHPPQHLGGVSLVGCGHSNRCVVVSHCFHNNLHVFGDIMMWITSFLMPVFHWIDKRTLGQIKSLLLRVCALWMTWTVCPVVVTTLSCDLYIGMFLFPPIINSLDIVIYLFF